MSLNLIRCVCSKCYNFISNDIDNNCRIRGRFIRQPTKHEHERKDSQRIHFTIRILQQEKTLLNPRRITQEISDIVEQFGSQARLETLDDDTIRYYYNDTNQDINLSSRTRSNNTLRQSRAVHNRSTGPVVPVEESSVDESSEEGTVEEIEPSTSYTRTLEERVKDLETRLERIERSHKDLVSFLINNNIAPGLVVEID